MDKDFFSVGAVLAGGAGQRLGGHKATQMLARDALVTWAARGLEGCVQRSVVGDKEAAKLIEAESLVDPIGLPSGPLTGVLAALIWAQNQTATFLVTVPCDTPFLPMDCASRLISAAMHGKASLSCARSDKGLEPLVAAWKVDEMLPWLTKALSEGRHPPVHALMRELGAAFVDLTSHETTNINTPAALLQAEDWLAQT
jgi:molybdenum cofactor guanylyltransferase